MYQNDSADVVMKINDQDESEVLAERCKYRVDLERQFCTDDNVI